MTEEQRKLVESAIADAEAAINRLKLGDLLAADILLKLAVDELADTGMIP